MYQKRPSVTSFEGDMYTLVLGSFTADMELGPPAPGAVVCAGSPLFFLLRDTLSRYASARFETDSSALAGQPQRGFSCTSSNSAWDFSHGLPRRPALCHEFIDLADVHHHIAGLRLRRCPVRQAKGRGCIRNIQLDLFPLASVLFLPAIRQLLLSL